MNVITTGLFSFAIAALCLVSVPGGGQAQQSVITKPYEFPIRPGMSEWKELKSHDERVEACQIPKEILTNMSDEALIITCLNYPLSIDLYLFDSVQIGFDNLLTKFNGLRELMKRKDVSAAIVSKYTSMSSIEQTLCDDNCRFRFLYLEIILSQDEILSGLQKSGRRELLQTSYSNHVFRQIEGSYGNVEFTSTGRLMSKILLMDGYGPYVSEYESKHELKELFENGPRGEIDELNTVVGFVEEYLAKPAVEGGEQ
jgi:hypothetical protein